MTAGPLMSAVVREEPQASLTRSKSNPRRHPEGIGPIYDSAHIGLCVLDRDLRFVHINAHLAQINGIPAEDHIGRTVREILPALAEALEPDLRRVIDTGEAAHDVEVSGETPARPGVRRTFTESWLPLRDASGEIVGINIVARETTEERAALEALIESRERWATEEKLQRRERELSSLTENSPDIVVRFDRALRHLYANAAIERATGRAAAEFIGKTHEELGFPPELCERLTRTLFEVLKTGEPRSLEYVLPGPDPGTDRERFYSMRAVPEHGPDGGIETVLCTSRDETERRKTDAKTGTLATVVETSGDFIGVAGLDGRSIYLNRAGQRLVGLDTDEAVAGTRIEDYLFPEDLPFVRGTVLPTVMEQGRWAGDFRFRHFVTGEPIDVHWDVVRIDDPDTGAPVQFGTVTRDIRTERTAAEALTEANRRKDEFLAVLGHELRNPMAPIRNAVDILQILKADQDPRIDWALAVLDRQAAHVSRLLDDLLDVSRIIRGQLKLERRPVALRGLVQQAVDDVRPAMTERGHRLVVDLPGPCVVVNGDPVRLSQILLNLLLNAANFTQEGGEIRVAARVQEAEVAVTVQDNGPGIPEDRLESLFEPFAQGERRDRATPGGLGLGLTISRRLAELHGGRLEPYSDWPQPGSEFRLRLPRLNGSVPSRAAPDPRPATAASALRVLVVDDNADVTGALAMLLEILGHQVQTATSGAEALEIVELECPRVALLDIALPDMDGLELARRIRALCPDRDRLLLVAVTGYGHDEARARSLAAGFDRHLAKPVDHRTLQALLAEVR